MPRKIRKLSRKRNQRKALLKSLARELFLRGKIRLTEARAKEVSRFAEKLIQKAKVDNLHSQKLLARNFPRDIVKKLINEIAPRYKPAGQKVGGEGKERKGGYTRIIKLGPRKSDGARMAIIELIK
jgi:large subunit ribosomal protein L17